MTYQLIHGDCLEIVPTLPPASVDAIITDLPYGTTACKWDTIIPFDDLWRIVKHVLKPRGAFVTTASQPFTSALVMSNPKWFKYEWIWKKNRGLGFQHARNMPIKQHENIVIFSDAPMGHKSILGESRMEYNPIGVFETGKIGIVSDKKHGTNLGPRPNQVGRRYEVRSGYPTSLLVISSVTAKDGIHPTQKPVALYEYLIKTYTNEGETVLDLCMGSGTTGVACKNTGRNFIGIEKDPTYFQIAKSRLEKLESSESVSVS